MKQDTDMMLITEADFTSEYYGNEQFFITMAMKNFYCQSIAPSLN